MTHPNFQTNGASLEDCHTNFFALVSQTAKYVGISIYVLCTIFESNCKFLPLCTFILRCDLNSKVCHITFQTFNSLCLGFVHLHSSFQFIFYPYQVVATIFSIVVYF